MTFFVVTGNRLDIYTRNIIIEHIASHLSGLNDAYLEEEYEEAFPNRQIKAIGNGKFKVSIICSRCCDLLDGGVCPTCSKVDEDGGDSC